MTSNVIDTPLLRRTVEGGLVKRLASAGSATVDMTQFDRGDISFIIMAAALVFFMVPGLALLYAGLARRKSALAIAWVVCSSNGVVIVQWLFWGHSLAFSSTSSNKFIGNLAHVALRGVLGAPSATTPLLPDLLLSFGQLAIACVTVGIWIGAVADRGRMLPAMVFTFVWMTVVYCPLVYWVWNPNGWAFKYGVLDFAGGGPVEIGAGFTGLAYSWILGRRRERELMNFRVSSVLTVALGMFVLWFGWIGFNAGGAFGANLRAVVAAWNTMVAGAFGGVTWCVMDYRLERKYTMVGLCFGILAGLIAATPSSGYLPPWSSAILGIVAAVICNFATNFKTLVRIDDAMDIFAEHGVGGMVGLLFSALCADSRIIALDGVNTAVKGGFINRNWQQLHIQLVYIVVAALYTFSVSALICKAMNHIPGLQLRCTEEEESRGLDAVEIGEYANDYMELRPDFRDWAQPAVHYTPSRHAKSLSIASSFTEAGNRDSIIHQSIPHASVRDFHSIKSFNPHKSDGADGKDFTLELEIPSPLFELPRTPKNTHVPFEKLVDAKVQPNDFVQSPVSYDYTKPPNL